MPNGLQEKNRQQNGGTTQEADNGVKPGSRKASEIRKGVSSRQGISQSN